MFFFLSLLTLVLKPSVAETILVDGFAVWRSPSVVVGDTIIFNTQKHYNLYIFHNKRDFNLGNFTRAILLTDPNSNSYTWHPSRPGLFYFLFNNASSKTFQESEKLPIEVSLKTPSPALAPSPTSGGARQPSPFISLQPPTISPTVNVMPGGGGGGGGGGMPFINSNPAVPLPTEAADSAALNPIPVSSGGGGGAVGQMVGLIPVQGFPCLVVLLMFCSDYN